MGRYVVLSTISCGLPAFVRRTVMVLSQGDAWCFTEVDALVSRMGRVGWRLLCTSGRPVVIGGTMVVTSSNTAASVAAIS